MRIRLGFESPLMDDLHLSADALPVVLGRSRTADVSIPDALISRHHCQIDFVEHQFLLRDLESTNGTVVNGEMIQECNLTDVDAF